jgi:hemerythrin-like domain-containing protein
MDPSRDQPSATPPPAARPQRTAIAVPPEFEALDRTHREVLTQLQAFDRLLQHVDDNGPDDTARASAAQILAVFSGAGHQHHADEETHVFPRLLASADASLMQHVRRLQQDHGWIEEDWRMLLPQMEAIATGYSWYDLPMLRLALPLFAALYREHIALEETVVYPAAQALLRAEQAAVQARQHTAA